MTSISDGETGASVRAKLNTLFITAETIAALAADTSLVDGKYYTASSAFNGEPETFLYDADSTATADGALIVDATGMGAGRLVSTRTVYANRAEFLADVREFATGTIVKYGVLKWEAVASSGDVQNAGGQDFDRIISDGVVIGDDGLAYRVLAGVIRNTGGGWYFLDDSGHKPTGFTGIVTNVDGTITLEHDVGATKVGSLTIAPDESYGLYGMQAGASVDLDSSTVRFYLPLEFSINMDGLTSTPSAVTSPLWGSIVTAKMDGGKVTVTHPQTLNRVAFSMTPSGATPYDYLSYSMRHPSSTTMDIHFLQDVEAYIAWSGSAWSVTGANSTNISASFSGGVLTVTHGSATRFDMRFGGRHPYVATDYQIGVTTSKVVWYDPSDSMNLVTTEDTNMDVTFHRGGINPIDGDSTDAVLGTYEFRGPWAQIDASLLTNTSGNFWCYGLMLIE